MVVVHEDEGQQVDAQRADALGGQSRHEALADGRAREGLALDHEARGRHRAEDAGP